MQPFSILPAILYKYLPLYYRKCCFRRREHSDKECFPRLPQYWNRYMHAVSVQWLPCWHRQVYHQNSARSDAVAADIECKQYASIHCLKKQNRNSVQIVRHPHLHSWSNGKAHAGAYHRQKIWKYSTGIQDLLQKGYWDFRSASPVLWCSYFPAG